MTGRKPITYAGTELNRGPKTKWWTNFGATTNS
ncbi:MAG: hypothetical protein QOJ20_5385 [Mycobacterium sp.]|jgi:hypothetical protein|nr:hypothetical protein [Mycobacterium sp.]MDT5284190.1 hypothetical protein [Mycobacterium sp.]